MANNNDLSALLGQLLDKNTLLALSKTAGVSQSDAQSVLANALPQLISGANTQATSANTVDSFLGALMQHSKDDSSNVTNFFQNVDLSDGDKIVKHLLGSNKQEVTKSVANNAGVDSSAVTQVLSAAAPLLLTLLGKQLISNAKKEQPKQEASQGTDLLSALLGGGQTKTSNTADLAGLAASLLGGATTTKKQDTGLDLGDVASLIGKFIK